MRIFGVILAGGQSRRMEGADKALITLASRPLVARVMYRIHSQVERVLISANGDPARFAGLGCTVVPDSTSLGPLSGILAGLQKAATLGATHIVSCPVDTPFLPLDMVARLVDAASLSPSGIAVARTAERDHPVCALWPTAVVPSLTNHLAAGGTKVAGFTQAMGAAMADFPDANAFLNVNTPEDLVRAEAVLKGGA